MKRLPMIICLLFILVGEGFPQNFSQQSDTGDIVEMFGDKIYVHGQIGAYAFEMITPCSWCESGSRVKISFQSFTRASILPDPNLLGSAPIQVFIVKDARQENQ